MPVSTWMSWTLTEVRYVDVQNTDFRYWMKYVFSVLLFKKQDPSFTYEVIVVDDGSKDQTTKVRKRNVLPRNQRYGFLHCSLKCFAFTFCYLKYLTIQIQVSEYFLSLSYLHYICMHKHTHTIIFWMSVFLTGWCAPHTEFFSAAEIVKIQILASINFWNTLCAQWCE